jgi:hypothetical protein
MAITINTEIIGQQAEPALTYCYLYEPLRINITEDDVTAQKLFIDVVRYDKTTSEVKEILTKYVNLDLNPGNSISVDLMEIAKQLHNSNIYKIATVSDIVSSYKNIIVSGDYYEFNVYTDRTATPTLIKKLPIIGGRNFSQFIPGVDLTQPLNEFALYGLDQNLISSRWNNLTFYSSSLGNLQGTNFDPILIGLSNASDCSADGGGLYWKSRFGGWMFWGFDIVKKTESNSYSGNLTVGMFETTNNAGGNAFIPVDYTGISSSYNLELKSLSLSMPELKAVAGISSSPAIYYNDGTNDRLELMRLSSASAPVTSLANGGDFTVGLQSISVTSQKSI